MAGTALELANRAAQGGGERVHSPEGRECDPSKKMLQSIHSTRRK